MKKWVGDGRTICCNLTCKVITAYARKGHHFHPFIVISFLPSLREGEVGHAGREEGRKEIGSKHVNVVPSSGICCNYFACQIAANGPSIIDPLFDLWCHPPWSALTMFSTCSRFMLCWRSDRGVFLMVGTVLCGNLSRRFCRRFSESSPCFNGQHGSCITAQRPDSLSIHFTKPSEQVAVPDCMLSTCSRFMLRWRSERSFSLGRSIVKITIRNDWTCHGHTHHM